MDQFIKTCFSSRVEDALNFTQRERFARDGYVTIALLIDPIVMIAAENVYLFQNEKFYSLSQFVALITSDVQFSEMPEGILTGTPVNLYVSI